MEFLDTVHKRYATKKFTPNHPLTAEQTQQIKTLLRFSPSSVNSQPWHFVIAQSDTAKGRLAQAAQGAYAANHAKILDASMVVVFCAKTDLSDEYLDKITEQEAQDGRCPSDEAKAMVKKTRHFYADLHRKTLSDTPCWMQKQVYLNLGFFLAGLAAMDLDAVPIEGVDFEALNSELALAKKGLQAQVVVAIGQRAPDDFNAVLPKSRLPEAEIITEI